MVPWDQTPFFDRAPSLVFQGQAGPTIGLSLFHQVQYVHLVLLDLVDLPSLHSARTHRHDGRPEAGPVGCVKLGLLRKKIRNGSETDDLCDVQIQERYNGLVRYVIVLSKQLTYLDGVVLCLAVLCRTGVLTRDAKKRFPRETVNGFFSSDLGTFAKSKFPGATYRGANSPHDA